MSKLPYELLSEIGFFVISVIHQVAQFCSVAGIATFNFAPQSDPKLLGFLSRAHFDATRKGHPK